MTIAAATIYEGRVMHHRRRPARHRFEYRVFALLLDIDRLAEADESHRLFSIDRFNLFSFQPRDHGDGSGAPLRSQIERLLADHGISGATHRIRLLCYPRILGFAFNPLSVFYCEDWAGRLRAVVYEVHNTFGERHAYVLPARGAGRVRHGCAKAFHVSPFIGMEAFYEFTLRPPADSVAVVIQETDAEGPLLVAGFTGTARPAGDGAFARVFFRYPLMTLKVVAAIHWEAFRLFLKRVPVHTHPARRQAAKAQ